jgi:hypothetical protein
MGAGAESGGVSDPPPLPPPPFWRTSYFVRSMANKPDRVAISLDDIASVVASPVKRVVQADGRFQLWGRDGADRHWLRVVVLSDGETVHNVFRDEGFRT